MRKFEPLLSAKIFSNRVGETQKNLAMLRFPLACSIKYDGWRLTEYNGSSVTRSLKQVRNTHVRDTLRQFNAAARQLGHSGQDGEVLVGPPNHPNAMQNTTSGVSSEAGTPEFQFFMFDSYQYGQLGFMERQERLYPLYEQLRGDFPWLQWVEQRIIHNLDEFLAYEAEVVAQGYEGIMARSLNGHYKLGRSTMREGILMALKRFVDKEALVVEYHEELENANPATTNLLGRTERSSHQANLIPKGRMGTMVCRSPYFEKPFNVGGGCGVTHDFRQEIWDYPQQFQWRVTKYSYQEVGVKDRPRLTKWKGWRAWEDIDPTVAAQLLALGDAHQWSGQGHNGVTPGCRPAL